jgi:hypothetical protein
VIEHRHMTNIGTFVFANCRNTYIHHGLIPHPRGLVQMKTKENMGQKKNN